MADKTNLGVKPLGRQGIISPQVQKEITALKNYGAALRAAGPSNNEAAAKLHRQAALNYLTELGAFDRLAAFKKTFTELGLDY